MQTKKEREKIKDYLKKNKKKGSLGNKVGFVLLPTDGN